MKKLRNVESTSPVSIASVYGPWTAEAPARLQSQSQPLFSLRQANSIEIGDNVFCRLDTRLSSIISADLPSLVQCADFGLKSGIEPCLVDGCLGGTYFLRDLNKNITVVWKPADEEPFAPQNPRQSENFLGKHRQAYKGAIVPGFGMFREVVAFSLDKGLAGVPPTHLAKVHHPKFNSNGGLPYKIGSVQSFARSICSAEDMGPSMFEVEDILRIAILDIRLCNLDRHAGNILVCHDHPYQARETPYSASVQAGDASTGYDKFPTTQPVAELSSSAPAQFGSYIPGPPMDTPAVRRHRLIPIDHGYTIPHLLHMEEVNFCWTEWTQADTPLSEELKTYIAGLNPEEDAAHIRKLVGAAIPEECLMTLWVCTRLLQLGVEAGLSLRSIGMLMLDDFDTNRSPLQTEVTKAVEQAYQSRSYEYHRSHAHASYHVDYKSGKVHRSQTVAGGCPLSDLGIFESSNITREDQLNRFISVQLSNPSDRIMLQNQIESALRYLLKNIK
eukprot:CAMPEP_0182416184 /NCGR_PEP_ID=MMETSP1167-20130531/339_1 /TAXON_ID=2988 /ORGANISM="Mallomonas Sp, Strain CCMP3275" /LENGTH=500 /DNA_ID=CAMNT_0024588697 /DNA_START=260 /DNA_END=1762 /DNA_ORIENTATION=+